MIEVVRDCLASHTAPAPAIVQVGTNGALSADHSEVLAQLLAPTPKSS